MQLIRSHELMINNLIPRQSHYNPDYYTKERRNNIRRIIANKDTAPL
jgi:hypothetical protein